MSDRPKTDAQRNAGSRYAVELTQAYLKSILDYEPDTGKFIWRVKIAKKICIGDTAGYVSSTGGYRYLKIHQHTYAAHRLAFYYMTGSWPAKEVDHINHDRDDNSWCNLRQADRKTNGRNHKISRRNTSGVVGVHWDNAKQKWHSSITFDGKIIFLGRYDNITDAANSRLLANKKYGFHENHGAAFDK